MFITLNEAIEAAGGKVIHGGGSLCDRGDGTLKGISTDTRTMKEGELYLALRGSRFDGHEFLPEALNVGCGAIVSVPPVAPPAGKVVIVVENTLKAFHDIARFIRKKSGLKVVGITGSNGKTTTKEMAASVLGLKYRVLKNEGNLNNQVGLPLSLLSMSGQEDVAVLEMGASAAGDISELCDIAIPDYGVVTNVGRAHLEGFGSLESVRSTKLELLGSVKTVVLNGDDAFLMEGLAQSTFKGRVITFGTSAGCDVRATDLGVASGGSCFDLSMGGQSERLCIPVAGEFNIYNALAAAAVGHAFGFSPGDVSEGMKTFKPVPMRFEIMDFHGTMLISDAYNANPASMGQALKELARLSRGRSVAVLGDMLELGPGSDDAHREVGRLMKSLGVGLFIGVGPAMALAADEFSRAGGMAITRGDSASARQTVLESLREGDTVLLKGSRGMLMEKVLQNAV